QWYRLTGLDLYVLRIETAVACGTGTPAGACFHKKHASAQAGVPVPQKSRAPDAKNETEPLPGFPKTLLFDRGIRWIRARKMDAATGPDAHDPPLNVFSMKGSRSLGKNNGAYALS